MENFHSYNGPEKTPGARPLNEKPQERTPKKSIFDTIREKITGTTIPVSPESEIAEKYRTVSQIEQSGDKAKWTAFLNSIHDESTDGLEKEAIIKHLSGQTLTTKDTSFLGRMATVFETRLRMADSVRNALADKVFFEEFFVSAVTSCKGFETPEEFRKQLLQNVDTLIITGGDAMIAFAEAYQEYVKAQERKRFLTVASEIARTDYKLSDSVLEQQLRGATNAEKVLDTNKLRASIKSTIIQQHSSFKKLFVQYTSDEEGQYTTKDGLKAEAKRWLKRVDEIIDTILVLEKPQGAEANVGKQPIENIIERVKKNAGAALEKILAEKSEVPAVASLMKSVSEKGAGRDHVAEGFEGGKRSDVEGKRRDSVTFGEGEKQEIYDAYPVFKERYQKEHRYLDDVPEEQVLDAFASSWVKDKEKNKGGGLFSRFLRRIRKNIIRSIASKRKSSA